MLKAEEIIEAQINFYNNHDLEGFVSTYHDDIKIYNLGDDAIILEGKDALREKYHERFYVQKAHAEIKNHIALGNKVIDHEKISELKDGSAIYSEAIAIYEVEDCLIKKVWFIR